MLNLCLGCSPCPALLGERTRRADASVCAAGSSEIPKGVGRGKFDPGCGKCTVCHFSKMMSCLLYQENSQVKRVIYFFDTKTLFITPYWKLFR